MNVDIEKAKASLSDLLDAVVSGEEVVLLRDERPIARLVPITQSEHRPQFGSARGLVTMADDFDAPLEDFAEYMP